MTARRTPSAVVVGAGIGGLVSAMLLASRGIDVRVLERAGRAGGKMRTHTVGGFEIDAGPTVFTMRGVFDELFAEVGACLEDELALQPAAILARHAWTDRGAVATLDLHADLEAAIDAIGGFAGAANARGYREFCVRAAAIHDALRKPFLRAHRTGVAGLIWRGGWDGLPGLLRISPFASLWSELERHFTDPRLRQLFGRYATYCGSSPWLAPATLMLVAHVERMGVWRVEGGMQCVAQAVEALALRGGARFRYGAQVDEILVRDGRACGVRLDGGEVVSADVVVFNGDVNALATGLLGAAVRRGMGARALRWRAPGGHSLSALTWSLAARTTGLPLLRHNVLFSQDYAAEFDALAAGRLPDDPTVYVCAQDRGDGGAALESDLPQRLLCLVNAPADVQGRSLTDQEIAKCERQAFLRMARCGLVLKPVAPMRRTTPSDFATLFPGTGGALYGPPSHGWRASFRRMGARHPMPGLYLAGGSTHPGPGRADGGTVGEAGGAGRVRGPGFDVVPPSDGYAWWYVDALSDDGRHALTIIAFIGSVFSPYYAAARRRGPADPRDHVAFNVALYGDGARRWTMTERGRDRLATSATALRIGPSAMEWQDDTLLVTLREIGAPWPRRVRGQVRIEGMTPALATIEIDAAGRHRWQPLAPRARVSVELDEPALRWSGDGYVDSNRGDEPLEDTFASWQWCRTPRPDGGAFICYDIRERNGWTRRLRLDVAPDGDVDFGSPRPVRALAPSRWGIARDAHDDARLGASLEDGPFYARSMLSTPWQGRMLPTFHESLSLDRFRARWVQAMLPFRMPRRSGAGG